MPRPGEVPHPGSVSTTSFGSYVAMSTPSASEKAIADKLAQERAAAQADPNAPRLPQQNSTMSISTPDDSTSAPQPTPDVVEAYPNIEAPDTIYSGQEIAVQVSLSDIQLAPETKILSGSQHEGKLQVPMEGEQQIRLTINVSAPGLEFTRGSNTQEITLSRDGNSSIAAFYMRPKLGPNGELPYMRNTRILATILHNQAFIARITRPIVIAENPAPTAPVTRMAAPAPARHALARQQAPPATGSLAPAPLSGLKSVAPTFTILENRVGNTLRIVFFLPDHDPVVKDIPDADSLHAWINAHFAEMARHGRGFSNVVHSATDNQSAADYLNAFGAELYDRIATPELTQAIFSQPPAECTIQVLSDDPSIPWELMRPIDPTTKQRIDFLGTLVSIARWPLMQSQAQKSLPRPQQTMRMTDSVVVAPQYAGAINLAAASTERDMLIHTPTFVPIEGTYAAIRYLAANPPHGFIHFAGHGAIRRQNGIAQYAILLNDGEIAPETWASLETSTTAPGTIYFFNACEVGESAQFMNDVDGWAPALLSSGASGYIGALWDISDSTANRFASVFYQSLIDHFTNPGGVAISDVLTETRRQVFAETKDPTALAYVFYGDPELRIQR